MIHVKTGGKLEVSSGTNAWAGGFKLLSLSTPGSKKLSPETVDIYFK